MSVAFFDDRRHWRIIAERLAPHKASRLLPRSLENPRKVTSPLVFPRTTAGQFAISRCDHPRPARISDGRAAPVMTHDQVSKESSRWSRQTSTWTRFAGFRASALSGRGCFQESRDGVRRRIYGRGTPEYPRGASGRSGATGCRISLWRLRGACVCRRRRRGRPTVTPSPLSDGSLAAETAVSGRDTALGLGGGHRDDAGETALSLRDGWESLPSALLPICHWGCAIYSLVDCSNSDGTMWGCDLNPLPSRRDGRGAFPQRLTIAALARALVCRPPLSAHLNPDPVTAQWRGASDDEVRECMAQE